MLVDEEVVVVGVSVGGDEGRWFVNEVPSVGSMGVEVEIEAALCPSTWPRSREGSMMLRTSFLSCFVSGEF